MNKKLYTLSLSKMNVIVDMINAEAVISGTFGTVPELKVRILSISLTADAALMSVEIAGLFFSDFCRCFFEVDRSWRLPFCYPERIHQVFPAEDDEVKNRDHGQQASGERG